MKSPRQTVIQASLTRRGSHSRSSHGLKSTATISASLREATKTLRAKPRSLCPSARSWSVTSILGALPEKCGPTETNRGLCDELKSRRQGCVEFLFKKSASNMQLWFNQEQSALRIQGCVHLAEEGRGVRNFMHHPERQNEINARRQPNALRLALVKFNATLQTGALHAPSDLRQPG